MSDNNAIDDKSRKEIVSKTDVNYFVEAGAGSGKTSMLVNRMVAMVEDGIDISQICAITFTKAAAGEFYERFRDALSARAGSGNNIQSGKPRPGDLPPVNDLRRERCEKALQNIDLCFLGTIDSFCNMVLLEHPFDAKIPSDSGLVTDLEMADMISLIYAEIGKGTYGQGLKNMYRSFRIFHLHPKDVFVSSMLFLMERRNAHFNFTSRNSADLDTIFANEKNALRQILAVYAANPAVFYTTKSDQAYLDDFANTYTVLTNGSWNRNYYSVKKILGNMEHLRFSPDGNPSVTFGPVGGSYFTKNNGKTKTTQYYIPNGGTSEGMAQRLEEVCYEVTMTFLTECIPLIEGILKEKGWLSYFDNLYYLRNLLKEDASKQGDLIKYINKRHRYFLIDEFQDTNPMQAEVFFYLATDKPVADWQKCVPRPGSLFIVGDPKQSIYRFRSADVTSFLAVKKLFTKPVGEVLKLPRNFRSTKELITYFNIVFQKLLPEETVNQSKFEPIPDPVNPPGGFTGVFSYESLEESSPYIVEEELDIPRIKSIIDNLVGNSKYKIETKDVSGLHPIRYRDIMILNYKKEDLLPIMLYLNKGGISTKVEGSVPFQDNEALQEVFKIFSSVVDLKNKAALYGALTGRILGFDQEDILAYKEEAEGFSYYVPETVLESENEIVKKIGKTIEELRELGFFARNTSSATIFTKILEQFRVYEIVSSDYLEVLCYTLELLRNAEKSGLIVAHDEAVKYLSDILNGKSGEERCLSVSENVNCVHLANLHKVKGLEAPVVILVKANLNSDPDAPDYRFEHKSTGSEGWIFRKNSEKNEKGNSYALFSTAKFKDTKVKEEKTSKQCERDRLNYVAATRARNVLIIRKPFRYKEDDDGNWVKNYSNRYNRWGSLLEGNTAIKDIFEKFAEKQNTGNQDIKTVSGDGAANEVGKKSSDDKTVSAKELYEKAESECVLKNREGVEKPSYHIVNPSKLKVNTKLSAEQTTVVAAPSKENEDSGALKKDMDHAALTGTMVHRLMEIWVSAHGKVNLDEVILEILNEYALPVNETYESYMNTVLRNVVTTMQNGGFKQTNGSDPDILKILLSAEEVHCEVPFCYRKENDGEISVINGIMDVVYREAGKWYIVDYKTNLEDKLLDTKYEAQLEAYIQAFKEATGEDAQARIYHIEV